MLVAGRKRRSHREWTSALGHSDSGPRDSLKGKAKDAESGKVSKLS